MMNTNKKQKKYGLTLLESVISIFIIAVAMLAVIGSYALAFKYFTGNINTSRAVEFAKRSLEEVTYAFAKDSKTAPQPEWKPLQQPNDNYSMRYTLTPDYYTLYKPGDNAPKIDARQSDPVFQNRQIFIGYIVNLEVKGPLTDGSDTPNTKYAQLSAIVSFNRDNYNAGATLKEINKRFIKMPFTKFNFNENIRR